MLGVNILLPISVVLLYLPSFCRDDSEATQGEKKGMEEIFKMLDISNDGRLSKAEISAFVASTCVQGAARGIAQNNSIITQ